MLKGIIETVEACVCIEPLPGADRAAMEQAARDNTLALTVTISHACICVCVFVCVYIYILE